MLTKIQLWIIDIYDHKLCYNHECILAIIKLIFNCNMTYSHIYRLSIVKFSLTLIVQCFLCTNVPLIICRHVNLSCCW